MGLTETKVDRLPGSRWLRKPCTLSKLDGIKLPALLLGDRTMGWLPNASVQHVSKPFLFVDTIRRNNRDRCRSLQCTSANSPDILKRYPCFRKDGLVS